ncbi:MFS transporter [Lactiplantibacillus sp. DA1]|uniref:MFS transporter n=1 Tax=Lactiplantibacillus sp. DA1 TaxID=3079857 RepID=UPI00292A64AF|nr:MFS transporter [Lactiplantibacillus sp. DA1]MDV0429446.1 MFS transporter [Lactiplantibacillus sp. DA1]
MTTSKRRLLTSTLLIAVFTALLNQTLMITALPVMMKTFQASLSLVQWLTTGYVLVLGIITPVAATLYERFSTRRLFLILIGGFSIASALGMVAPNFYILLAARLIQAMMGGVLMTFAQIALLAMFPDNQRGTILGLFSMVVSAGPAVGPTFAGILLARFSWHSLFMVVFVVMLLVGLIGFITLPNLKPAKIIKIDWWSMLLSFFGMGILLIGISALQDQTLIGTIEILGGVSLIAIFARRQLSATAPLLNLKLLRQGTFLRMTIVVMLNFAIMMGTETILPVLLETHRGYSSMTTGLIMLPGALANLILAPIVGRLYDHYGLKWLLISGLILQIIAFIPLWVAATDTSLAWIIIGYTLRMASCALITSVTITESLASFTGTSLSHGTTLSNTGRQVAGSLGNTLLVWALNMMPQITWGFRAAMLLTMIGFFFMVILCWQELDIASKRVSH